MKRVSDVVGHLKLWRIQGCQGRAPPWSNFFHCHALISIKFTLNSGVGTPVWEILDPPLKPSVQWNVWVIYTCGLAIPSKHETLQTRECKNSVVHYWIFDHLWPWNMTCINHFHWISCNECTFWVHFRWNGMSFGAVWYHFCIKLPSQWSSLILCGHYARTLPRDGSICRGTYADTVSGVAGMSILQMLYYLRKTRLCL